jgi:outer membrane receptor for ferric coprogen and ferric-rhodotorulic acid
MNTALLRIKANPQRLQRRRKVPLLSAAALCAALLGGADTLPAQSAPTPAAVGPMPRPVRAVDELIELSPFEVKAEADKSYGALNSNSLTAFTTELKTMPVSADVFSETFMRDIGMSTVEEMLQAYSAGAGTFSLQPDGSAANNQYLDRNANGSLSLRGLSAPTMQVNGFFPSGGNGLNGTGITSNFFLERVEVIGGPQALLYGVSGSGGVTNVITKQARFGRSQRGSYRFQVDQFGHKQAQFDYSWSTDRLAARVALIHQMFGSRRLFIGGPMNGGYAQVAYRPFHHTVLRYSMERTSFDRINANSGSMTLSAQSTANDARNGQQLHWLLATNQVYAAANGAPSGAGPIMNGALNWDNVDSIAGGPSGETQRHHLHTLTAETRWSSWLSTQISGGYRWERRKKMQNSGVTFQAPNVNSNPTGTWAVTVGSGSGAATYTWQPVRQKVARFSALAEKDFFGGRARTKTVTGVDTTRTDGAVNGYYFVQMDENWNPVRGTTNFNGYIPMPAVWWPVTNGPVKDPLWPREDSRITWNGVNYGRVVTNDTDAALISPTNPQGLTGRGTGSFRHSTDIQSGYYAANLTDWLNGRLTTLVGFRHGKAYSRAATEASAPNPPSVGSENAASYTAFSAGANYALTRTLRVYVEASDNYNPAASTFADPYGEFSKPASGTGSEAGLKYASPGGRVSGTLALYRTKSKNELHAFTSTLTNYINPAGLNGRYGPASNTINVDRQTSGAQIVLTAAPRSGWRIRMSGAYVDSEIATEKIYAQLYNDQFYANAQGNVTYRDGTPVYVNPTATQVLTASSPNAVPLTIALMNTPTSRYYANPVAVSSQITSNAQVATILRTVDPVRGPILTGATGLPISALQIAPNAMGAPPGRIIVTQRGDVVTGVPKYSANLTNVYTFRDGLLRGFRVGGSVMTYWKSSLYYYYPNGAGQPNTRALWYKPDLHTVSGIFGYEMRLGRYTFSTQLNIQNMFNRYNVVLLPNYVNGWAGPNNATFDAQPRMYVWSSTVEF